MESVGRLSVMLDDSNAELFIKQCTLQLSPLFWSDFSMEMPTIDVLCMLMNSVRQLKVALMPEAQEGFEDHSVRQSCGVYVFHGSVCLQVPPFLSTLVEKLCMKAFLSWSVLPKHEDEGKVSQETLVSDKFKELVTLLHSVRLFDTLMAFPLKQFVEKQVNEQVSKLCSCIYDVPMVEKCMRSLCDGLMSWLLSIVGGAENSALLVEKWKVHVIQCCYKYFAHIRISQLFEIIVDFPESEPALKDLAVCLKVVDLKQKLIHSLGRSIRMRLLHPGVNTADIITQYVAAIKALRLVDHTGVVLERVCTPVRDYLFSRDDTVRCIVTSLTNETDSELAQALNKDDIDEHKSEDQDFDLWEPDPIDGNQGIQMTNRQSSDIISLLVSIYGSCEMFVSEYRNLLADRLLQMCSYNISREISTLELLKQRFGESPLHFCEVMLKDVGDSKRMNNLLKSSVENIDSELEIQAMVISSEFWPTFREENFQVPGFAKRKMDLYSMEYKQLKGMRKLDWKTGLGTIEIEVSYGEEVITMRVSPLRAVILHQFQNNSECTIDLLTQSVKAPPIVVKKHVGFWVSQGLLKEISSDVYRLMQEWNFDHKAAVKFHDDDEFMMETDKDAMEAECQIYWNYIKHMLTNLGPLSLERIHSMLEIFGVQGNTKKKLAITYLRAFLNNKTLQQQICFENGSYSLCK